MPNPPDAASSTRAPRLLALAGALVVASSITCGTAPEAGRWLVYAMLAGAVAAAVAAARADAGRSMAVEAAPAAALLVAAFGVVGLESWRGIRTLSLDAEAAMRVGRLQDLVEARIREDGRPPAAPDERLERAWRALYPRPLRDAATWPFRDDPGHLIVQLPEVVGRWREPAAATTPEPLGLGPDPRRAGRMIYLRIAPGPDGAWILVTGPRGLRLACRDYVVACYDPEGRPWFRARSSRATATDWRPGP